MTTNLWIIMYKFSNYYLFMVVVVIVTVVRYIRINEKNGKEKNLWWFIMTIAMFKGGGQRSFHTKRKIFFHHALQSPSLLFREDTYCIMGQKPIIIISTVKTVIWSENNMFCFLWMSLLKCTRILPKISFFYVLIKGTHYSLYMTSDV